MGDVVKFVAGLFLIAFLLVFTVPLLWLVIKLVAWLFGGVLVLSGWTILLILSVIAIFVMLAS